MGKLGQRGRRGVERLLRRARTDAATEEQPTARRGTLVDPALQRRFERDGYVVVDLLDDATVAEIAARYERMDHERREQFDWVDGFSTSIYDIRPAYRTEVLSVMEQYVAPALADVLDRYRIMWANFLVKQPGADAVPPHVDWTFLDEDRFSSVTIWSPLTDTTPENGTLGVVTGSQRRIDFLRASNVPTFERCEQAVADIDDRPVIPVRAGQAIIMDNRVVHFSTPNTADEWRVVVGCVAGPVEAELHHYWMDEQERLLRLEIDRTFYLSYVIGDRPTESAAVRSTDVAQEHALR